jgi:hypothetical protein
MEMQQIMQMLAKLQASQDYYQEKMAVDRKDDKEESRETNQGLLKEMKEDLLTKMKEDRKADQEKISADKEDFLARIGQQTKDLLSHINQSTQNLRTELTDEIQKTQTELQTVEISIDKRTRCVEEDIEAIREDITANKQKVQSQLEQVKAIAERGSRPTLSANTAQLPTFDGKTSWSTFRQQFETVAEHDMWSQREKSTFLITALKGRAAEVLAGIPINTPYEDTLQALEDRFGDQHFAAAN